MDAGPNLPTYLVEKQVYNKFAENKKLWSNLPSDILSLIFNKLKKNKDAFAQVCRYWRMIADHEMFFLFKSFGLKSAHLLRRTEFAELQILNLDCSISGKENSYNEIETQLIISSCRGGWILLLDRDTNDLHIWNPLLDIKIGLPDFQFQSRIVKAVTFFGEFGIGVAVISEDGKLSFIKYGDLNWRVLIEGGQYEYEDLISSKGSILALMKNRNGNGELISLQAWNFEGTNILNREINFPEGMEESRDSQYIYIYKLYIADWKGRIFLVVKWLKLFVDYPGPRPKESLEVYETVNFYVYFFDENTIGWNRVNSLGDRALFIGQNQTVMVCAEEFEKCRKNYIYFTGYYWIRTMKKKIGSDEMKRQKFSYFGYFCLEDSRVRKCRNELSNFLSPCWMISGV